MSIIVAVGVSINFISLTNERTVLLWMGACIVHDGSARYSSFTALCWSEFYQVWTRGSGFDPKQSLCGSRIRACVRILIVWIESLVILILAWSGSALLGAWLSRCGTRALLFAARNQPVQPETPGCMSLDYGQPDTMGRTNLPRRIGTSGSVHSRNVVY